MIGCFTNNSSQPLSSAAIEFTSTMTGGGGFFAGNLEFPVEVIQPGATVPFRKYGNLDPNETSITVLSMDSNVGEININVTVTR